MMSPYSVPDPPMSFNLIKKKLSVYVNKKIQTFRLAYTDITYVELVTENAIKDRWMPENDVLVFIAASAFNLESYCKIVKILHKRLDKLVVKKWRYAFHALLILEYLLLQGPEMVADEFKIQKNIIKLNFAHYVRREDWDDTLRHTAKRIVRLLEDSSHLEERRIKAESTKLPEPYRFELLYKMVVAAGKYYKE